MLRLLQHALEVHIQGNLSALLPPESIYEPPHASFFSQFQDQVSAWLPFAVILFFGAMIAIICCYKGLTASGGPEGVGRAVNQAIVICFMAIGCLDYVFTQTLLATHPEILNIK